MLEPRCGLACLPDTFPCIGRRATNGTPAKREMTCASRKLRDWRSVNMLPLLHRLADQSANDLLGVQAFRLSGEGGNHAMREHRYGDFEDILQPNHVAAVQRGAALRAEDQVLHGTR